ncbi:class I SAM-dependent RNA methyltransferase [Candidatus Woesearchaeota archaeon]|nr:class I SAM-dependent RNA methyltransferase [Candidatus Woesearchaeota archaeon]
MHELKIESLASTGLGVARIKEEGFNRAIFVPFTCPGDVVRARITERKKKYYVGETVELVSKSPDRVPIRCKHFGICGSCDLLHIKYKKQVEFKREFVRYILRDVYNGKIDTITGNPDFYRSRIRVFSDGKNAGWKKYRSNEVVNVEECRIIGQSLLPELGKLRGKAGEYVLFEDAGIWNAASKDNFVWSYGLNGQKIFFSPSCFIQGNVCLNENLVNLVAGEVKKTSPRSVLELFSGVGNFSSQIKGCRVTCVEGNRLSSHFGKINAGHCEHINQDVYKFLEKNKDRYDVVLLDPPREGISEGHERRIAEITERIIYVSCDAEALKNNLRRLREFEIENLWLVDMFPHTHHVELVAVLGKKK